MTPDQSAPPTADDHLRHHRRHEHLAAPFGADAFGRGAEHVARFFGTPRYILTQTAIVVLWVAFNGFEIFVHFDKYPFILLNLAFSTQAAYAAPLILLAQTRQADRDKATAEADARHREELAERGIEHQRTTDTGVALLKDLIEQNTALTAEVSRLTREIHRKVGLPES